MSKILIVEDDAEIAMLEKDYLEINDFETEIVADGEVRNTPQEPNAAAIYAEMIDKNRGAFNQETLSECQEIVKAAVAEYGKGDEMERQMRINPSLIFATQYVNFGNQVNIYWNGPTEQKPDNILGVYPIQEKLKELESANMTDSYDTNIIKNVWN